MKKVHGAYIEKVYLEIFDAYIHIVVTEHPNEYIDKSKLRVWTGDNPDHNYEKYCDGLCISKGNSDFYIIVPPDVTLNVAVHETCHATNKVFASRGQIAYFVNDEIYCYYIGWLSQKVADHINEAYNLITKPSIPREGKSAEAINS